MENFPLDKLVEFIAMFIKNLINNFVRMKEWADEYLKEETTAAE